jgi:phosphatidate cytidylyltransferase
MAGAKPGAGAAPGAARNPDLRQRAASAAVMLAVAGVALWLGGLVWTIFVAAIALGVLFEWRVLVILAHPAGGRRTAWSAAGAVYCGIGAAVLMELRQLDLSAVVIVLLAVIATDIGAYFAGRTFGGPRIAPAISPSKTWSGLFGAMIASGALLAGWLVYGRHHLDPPRYADVHDAVAALRGFVAGMLIALVAQAGDFFESWMKRRAGVKDSGRLIPGHGGLFDRVDGLLSVLFVLGIVFAFGHLEGSL